MTAVLGYKRCSCGAPVLKEVAYATEGHCVDCWLDKTEDERDKIELMIDGRTSKLSTRPDRRRANATQTERRKTNPAYSQKHNAIIYARRRAQRRLAAIHRREYLELLAAERARVGMDPWPVVLAVEYQKLSEAEGKTMSRSDAYDPSDAQAQDVDAASEPRQGTA